MEGPLYACGGHDGWAYLSSVERWDPGTQTWSYVAEMNKARNMAGVAVIGTKLVILVYNKFPFTRCNQTCCPNEKLEKSIWLYHSTMCVLTRLMIADCTAWVAVTAARYCDVLSATILTPTSGRWWLP